MFVPVLVYFILFSYKPFKKMSIGYEKTILRLLANRLSKKLADTSLW